MATRSRRRRHSFRSATAAPRPPAETPLGIVSFGGSQLPWQWLWATPHEYNPNLMGRLFQDTCMKMFNDDQIRGLTAIVAKPIIKARWRVVPGGGTTLDKQIARFVEQTLLEDLETPLDHVLYQMIMAEFNGFSVHEKEYARAGAQTLLAGLWDILPNTVEQVLYRPDRRIAGLWQWGTDVNGHSRRQQIEAERLLFTIAGGRGGSAAGDPLFRAMYAPWYIKHPLQKLMTVGLENSLIGTVWAKVPRTMSPTDRQALRQAIEEIRVRDATGFVLDADVILEILEGKRNAMDAMPFIEYLDNQMSKVALAQFLNMGTTQSGGGSRAVSENHATIFLVSEDAIADRIKGNANRHLVRQLVDFNWPGYHVYPSLDHDDIVRIFNITSVGDSLNKLLTGGALHWTMDLENAVRDWHNFDPLPDDFNPAPVAAAPPVLPPSGGGEGKPPAAAAAVASGAQASGLCEHHAAHLVTLDDAMQTAPGVSETASPLPALARAGDGFQARAAAILNDMIRALDDAARADLGRPDVAAAATQAVIYDQLAQVPLPGRDRLRDELADYFAALADLALQSVAQVRGDDVGVVPEGARLWMDAQVDLLAQRLPDQLRAAYLQQVLSGAMGGVSDAQLVSDAAQAARDRLNVNLSQFFTEAITDLLAHVASGVTGDPNIQDDQLLPGGDHAVA